MGGMGTGGMGMGMGGMGMGGMGPGSMSMGPGTMGPGTPGMNAMAAGGYGGYGGGMGGGDDPMQRTMATMLSGRGGPGVQASVDLLGQGDMISMMEGRGKPGYPDPRLAILMSPAYPRTPNMLLQQMQGMGGLQGLGAGQGQMPQMGQGSVPGSEDNEDDPYALMMGGGGAMGGFGRMNSQGYRPSWGPPSMSKKSKRKRGWTRSHKR